MASRASAAAPPREEAAYVLAAAALIALATAAWWALALWPAADQAPAWLTRTRLVCFGVRGDGLPDAAGWLALIGQPIGMLAVLFIGWREGVLELLRLARQGGGARRVLQGAVVLLLGAGLLAGWRIRSALAESAPWTPPAAGGVRRLDRPAPALALVDQHGQARTLAELRGRPVLLTFAYAHCETVCPLSVRAVVDAGARLRASAAAALGAGPATVIVTLDPWRDTPERLPALAKEWRLPPEALALGGPIDRVEAVLDAWNVARSRDPRTGEITHAPVVYVLDVTGRIAYQAPADAGTIAALVRRL